jgi:hypothetical protein
MSFELLGGELCTASNRKIVFGKCVGLVNQTEFVAHLYDTTAKGVLSTVVYNIPSGSFAIY